MHSLPARIFRLILLFLVITYINSGCSSQANKPGVENQDPNISNNTGEKAVLSIWVVEKKDTFLAQLAEEYEQEHPNIDVRVREIPEEKYIDQLEDHLRAGTAPDIAQVRQPAWLASGYFLSLDDAIAAFRVPFDSLNIGAITRDCVFDGQVYCLGSLTSGIILVYNKDVFDLFNTPYPSANEPMSIEEYHNLILRLTQRSDKLEERIWGGEAAPYFTWMDPGTHISPDGRIVAGFLNDEVTSTAYQWLADAYQKGASINDEEANSMDQSALELLIAGRLATALVDSATAIPILEQSGIHWGATIVPTEKKGDAKWSSNLTDGFGATTSGQQPETAVSFLVFLVNRGSQLRLERGEMPLNMHLAEQWAAGSNERRQVFEALNLERPYPFIPGYAEATSILWDAWVEMTDNGVPAKQALDAAAGPMQEILDRNWEKIEAIQPQEQIN